MCLNAPPQVRRPPSLLALGVRNAVVEDPVPLGRRDERRAELDELHARAPQLIAVPLPPRDIERLLQRGRGPCRVGWRLPKAHFGEVGQRLREPRPPLAGVLPVDVSRHRELLDRLLVPVEVRERSTQRVAGVGRLPFERVRVLRAGGRELARFADRLPVPRKGFSGPALSVEDVAVGAEELHARGRVGTPSADELRPRPGDGLFRRPEPVEAEEHQGQVPGRQAVARAFRGLFRKKVRGLGQFAPDKSVLSSLVTLCERVLRGVGLARLNDGVVLCHG